MLRNVRPAAVLACCVIFSGCALRSPSTHPTTLRAPVELLGTFTDDYGNAFRVADSLFHQLPRGRFHIVQWNVAERYFIARNDPGNPTESGLWTRIDWMPFTGMAPYIWGFCMTAFGAPTREAARATAPANRAAPRTGCNGYPFSRMKPAPDPSRPSGTSR